MKHIGSGSPITNTEIKFWTCVKRYFTTHEDDEPVHWSDIAIMLVGGVLMLWVVLLGLGVRVLNM